MVPTLQLTLTDYADPAQWRWVLNDARGKFLADHDVRLDAASCEYRGFLDLAQSLAERLDCAALALRYRRHRNTTWRSLRRHRAKAATGRRTPRKPRL